MANHRSFSDDEKRLIAQERYEFPVRYMLGVPNTTAHRDLIDAATLEVCVMCGESFITPPASDGA